MAITKSKTAKAFENKPDTKGVVGSVKGHVAFGHMRVSGNKPGRNSMVSGNTGLKKRG